MARSPIKDARFDTNSEDGAGSPDGARYYNYVRLMRGGGDGADGARHDVAEYDAHDGRFHDLALP